VRANDAAAQSAAARVGAAFAIGDAKPAPTPLVIDRV